MKKVSPTWKQSTPAPTTGPVNAIPAGPAIGACSTARTRLRSPVAGNPAGRKPGGGQGASITPLQLL